MALPPLPHLPPTPARFSQASLVSLYLMGSLHGRVETHGDSTDLHLHNALKSWQVHHSGVSIEPHPPCSRLLVLLAMHVKTWWPLLLVDKEVSDQRRQVSISLQKPFNQGLCYVSCTCVAMSILVSYVLHNHNISLCCWSPQQLYMWCSIWEYSLHGPTTYVTKVFVKGTVGGYTVVSLLRHVPPHVFALPRRKITFLGPDGALTDKGWRFLLRQRLWDRYGRWGDGELLQSVIYPACLQMCVGRWFSVPLSYQSFFH